jgi:hypothetical protein
MNVEIGAEAALFPEKEVGFPLQCTQQACYQSRQIQYDAVGQRAQVSYAQAAAAAR